jgi:hypothetical protein
MNAGNVVLVAISTLFDGGKTRRAGEPYFHEDRQRFFPK